VQRVQLSQTSILTILLQNEGQKIQTKMYQNQSSMVLTNLLITDLILKMLSVGDQTVLGDGLFLALDIR